MLMLRFEQHLNTSTIRGGPRGKLVVLPKPSGWRSRFRKLLRIEDEEKSMVVRYTLAMIAVAVAPLLGLLLLTHFQPDVLLLDITPSANID